MDPADHGRVDSEVRQLEQQEAVFHRVEGLRDVQVDDIDCGSVLQIAGHMVPRGQEVRQTGPASAEPVLAAGEKAVGIEVLGHCLLQHRLLELADDACEADRAVAGW